MPVPSGFAACVCLIPYPALRLWGGSAETQAQRFEPKVGPGMVPAGRAVVWVQNGLGGDYVKHITLRIPDELVQAAVAQVGVQGSTVAEVYRNALRRGLAEEISRQAVSPLIEAMDRAMPSYLAPLWRAARANYFNSVLTREQLKNVIGLLTTLSLQLAGEPVDAAIKHAASEVARMEEAAVAKARRLTDENKLLQFVEGDFHEDTKSGGAEVDAPHQRPSD